METEHVEGGTDSMPREVEGVEDRAATFAVATAPQIAADIGGRFKEAFDRQPVILPAFVCAFRRKRAAKPIDGGQLFRLIAGSCGVRQFGSSRLALVVVT